MVKIQASIIFEIMGRPREYLVESMEEVISKVGKEEGVEILNKKIHEPRELEERKGIYTTFAEADMEFEKEDSFFMMLFSYMPANVEVTSPAEWKFQINEFNIFLNELLRKLHQYDNLAKAFILEKNNMQAYIQQLIQKIRAYEPDFGEQPQERPKESGKKSEKDKSLKEKKKKTSKKKK